MKRMLRSSVCGHEHLKPLLLLGWVFRLSVITVFFAASVQAQFTANIQGTVVDPSGAAIAQAKVDRVNTVTQVSATTTTDASVSYLFLSLAPGSDEITDEANAFPKLAGTSTAQ